ncbi:MAG: hypothetical protein ACXW0Z_15455 [Gemmatirosa sp.]
MHDPSPSPSPEPLGALTSPPALPAAGWVVGSEGRAPVSGPDAAARRAARLDARLAVYAQHAAALAEQAAATLDGDQARADAFGLQRSAAAEHFAELQGDAGAASPGAAAPFDALLSDALLELEHQAAVDLALRQRLAGLRDAMARGATWVSETGLPALTAGAGSPGTELEALPDFATAPVDPMDGELDEAAMPAHPLEGLEGGLEGGLVAARADGVGRALGGQYPGLVAREAMASVLAAAERVSARPAAAMADPSGIPGRVDLTF